jgi:glucose-6-phosphate-specific signal transduction histidine kinase
MTQFDYSDMPLTGAACVMNEKAQESDDPQEAELSATDLLDTLRHLATEIEVEKSSIARTLHDEIGGLLVGAVMDMGWISHQGGQSDIVRDRLARAIWLLRAAIDIGRKLVEALRPSLLDDVGLCSTMGWHLKTSCQAAGVSYSESYPPNEPLLSADFKIAVFRIFQKALHQVLSDGVPSELFLQVEIIGDTMHCHIASHLLNSRAAGAELPVNAPLHYHQIGVACRWRHTLDESHVNVTIPMPLSAA